MTPRIPPGLFLLIAAPLALSACGKESGGADAAKSKEEAFLDGVRGALDKAGDFAKELMKRSELEDKAKALREKVETLEKEALSAADGAKKRVEDSKANLESTLADLRSQVRALNPMDAGGDPKIKKQVDDIKRRIEEDIAAAKKKLDSLASSGK